MDIDELVDWIMESAYYHYNNKRGDKEDDRFRKLIKEKVLKSWIKREGDRCIGE